MPKSKRTKLVSLTKTPKRSNKARKSELIDDIREAAEHYRYLFLFTIFNFRSTHMKDIRIEFKEDSRFILCYCTYDFDYLIRCLESSSAKTES